MPFTLLQSQFKVYTSILIVTLCGLTTANISHKFNISISDVNGHQQLPKNSSLMIEATEVILATISSFVDRRL